MRTAIISLTFYLLISLNAGLAEPAIAAFSGATKEDYDTVQMACGTHIQKAQEDVTARLENTLLYRSSLQCKTISGRTYCLTFFVHLLNPPKCSRLFYTRGHALLLDGNDRLAQSVNSDKMEGGTSYLLNAGVGALVVHSSNQFLEFNMVR